MEKDLYLKKLTSYTHLSLGLSTYLKFVARRQSFNKFQKIKPGETRPGALMYLTQGSARIFIYDQHSEREHTIMFWMRDECLTDLAEVAKYLHGQVFMEFLEYTNIICIPENHIQNIRRLFPESVRLTDQMHAEATGKIILQLCERQMMDADSRLDKLLKTYPDIFTRAAVKDVATYLGIHSSTLSKMRHKHSK